MSHIAFVVIADIVIVLASLLAIFWAQYGFVKLGEVMYALALEKSARRGRTKLAKALMPPAISVSKVNTAPVPDPLEGFRGPDPKAPPKFIEPDYN
jgi:hypothetical protein